MSKYIDQTFDRTTVRLDGNEFVRCRFLRCRIEIGAEAPFIVEDCENTPDCEVVLVGAAKNFVRMLAALYQDPNQRPGIDGLFASIRAGKPKVSGLGFSGPAVGFDA